MRDYLTNLIHKHPICIALIAALLVTNIGSLAVLFQYRADLPKDVSRVGTYQQDGQYVTATSDDAVRQMLIKGNHIFAFEQETDVITAYKKVENYPFLFNVKFE